MENTNVQKLAGNVQISVSVVEKLAKLAAMEIEGVKEVAENSRSVKGALSKVKLTKPVEVEMDNDGIATITVSIIVKAGTKIPSVCRDVQQAVKSGVQSMTNITVSKVNVVVSGVEAIER